MKKESRVKRNLGRAKIIPLPEGWKHGETGYIIPTMGYWKDRPIKIGSKFAELLGWPEECREKLKLSIEYPDGTVVNEDGSITKPEKDLIPVLEWDSIRGIPINAEPIVPVLDNCVCDGTQLYCPVHGHFNIDTNKMEKDLIPVLEEFDFPFEVGPDDN